ncbi:alpha/beta hydrolase [Paraburkholderia dipogonis]|uniref:Alpha/beta hydrolase n=2 Tax=Paraburkholderia dipogonis TaxID=1211383 RepID=A0A4Y8MJ27_9BURK|nr:alpha/beta hydrolase [Paraburkholderia dipogonis]TFE37373.1 alpha/beta hydrolase [Paraburkholderia dipogonis]
MFSKLEWPQSGLPGFNRGYKTVDGIRMHYVSGGEPSGEVIVLMCGFPQSWYAWRKLMPLLADRYHVIALDLPGQGDSDRPTGTLDTTRSAKLVRGLLEQLGVERHGFVLHDIGAWVGYPYAALYGQHVTGVAIVDTGIPGISLPDTLPWASDVAWRTWHVAFHNIPDLPEALLQDREHIYLQWYLQRKAAKPQVFSQADFEEYLRVFKANGWKGGLAYYRAISVSAQQNRELSASRKLEMPVLAVRADQGSMPDLVPQLKAIANNVTGTTIASGHYVPEEEPEPLAAELKKFFG